MSWAKKLKLRLQIASIMMAFFAPGFLIWLWGETRQQLASRDWPSVEGTVDAVMAMPWQSGRREWKYFGRVHYRYRVGNQEYSTDLTDLGPGIKRSTQQQALADVQQYQPGEQVTVYYDPANPQIGVLQKGMTSDRVLLNGALVVLSVICPIVAAFSVLGWARGRKRAPPAPEAPT